MSLRARCKQPSWVARATLLIVKVITVFRAMGETDRIREPLTYQEGMYNALPMPTFVPDLHGI